MDTKLRVVFDASAKSKSSTTPQAKSSDVNSIILMIRRHSASKRFMNVQMFEKVAKNNQRTAW